MLCQDGCGEVPLVPQHGAHVGNAHLPPIRNTDHQYRQWAATNKKMVNIGMCYRPAAGYNPRIAKNAYTLQGDEAIVCFICM